MAGKFITCKDCGRTFEFTDSEQAFFKEKGFENEPQRCPECRAARKQQLRGNRNGPREMFPAVCSRCGKSTTVPFNPSSDKPVYCDECFKEKRR
ncbi:MAG TPA: zinc-ribbon domain containing protein [Eubacteriales bacterium]|jgi:CxxC-x17-CxxC domain-containing protein|nr:zinc-ribbon domain containing protein [Clostridia bacterium]HRR89297.1 zinc-ribbon domain containing protein [Eubacteriales bacterium]HRU84465.1 zinc-ribbon domain containing protein [Eubacteriales bacterium]